MESGIGKSITAQVSNSIYQSRTSRSTVQVIRQHVARHHNVLTRKLDHAKITPRRKDQNEAGRSHQDLQCQ